MLPIRHVLLADPDGATRKALALLLKSKLGLHNISEASDGETLTGALAECAPDLLLLDWSLPGRPARDVCQQWRCAHPAMRLVVLSVDAAHAAEAAAIGASFIHKGSAAEQVLEQLRTLVEPSRRSALETGEAQ